MFHLDYDIVGKDGGNFKPQYDEPKRSLFLKHLRHELDVRGLSRVFAPHCEFTTNVARLGDGNEENGLSWFVRTTTGFDGGIVTEPGTAIAIFNADCPVVILFDKESGRLALLHAGFRCLVPKDQNEPNIIDTALNNPLLDTSKLEAFIGFGAGPCCYGINHIDESEKEKLKPFTYRATKGPRTGQTSLNLVALAQQQLVNHGIEEGLISQVCTACSNYKGICYHSNIYEGELAGRNLVLAWFTR